MFFEFICLLSVLLDIINCLPSSNHFFNSNKPSTRMSSFAPTSHVSTRLFQNALSPQLLLDNKLQQKSVLGSPEYDSFLKSNVPSIRISSFVSPSPLFTKIFQNEQLLQQLKNEEVVTENAPRHREKRGIVIIDEDFNIPPEPGVKQGWGDGNFEKNVTKSDKKSIEIMSTEEGSGQTEEGFSTDTIHNTTPELLQISTNKIKVIPTKEYRKMTSTSEYTDKETSTSEHTDKETSTSEHADKMVSTSGHAEKETSPMEYTDKMATTEDIEGSGEISVSTQISSTTEEPKEQEEKSAIKVCLKHTCNSDDLLLTPGITRKVPEGTNLTLSCSSVNTTEHGVLKLYKYNDSENLLLEESNKEEKLNFDIPMSQRHHSGTYMCLKFTEESCCHQQLDITVYEMPNYKTHLIIIGLVAAISLFTCILLGIYRSFKTKNYEVQMELQNMEKPVLF
ncbi:hypothetical protein HNY73_003571 [Argiope bruennichi]|uniref:Ig-like domain-containing protein n=1 Tax=Argiope bruennichi TaxID=94029 RepID=A0A8T0FNH8_ARGBR|nr:hypothetical protein HNY73_003571 [Argiope bruennichi]